MNLNSCFAVIFKNSSHLGNLFSYVFLKFIILGSRQAITELSDVMIQRLSCKITNVSELHKLGIDGLRLKAEEVDSHINNYHDSIVTAAYHTIKHWCKSQPNRGFAYNCMCNALNNIGMGLLIKEALNKNTLQYD